MEKVTEENIRMMLGTVFDPELRCNVVELGLVYRVGILDDRVEVDYTLTSPACPSMEYIATESFFAVEKVAGGRQVVLNLVWDPPWTPERMTEEARFQLGYPV